MENKFKVADNWECANSLERFKQLVLDPLKKKVDDAFKYTTGKEFDDSPKERQEKIKKRFEQLKSELERMDDVYNASFKLVQRHEAVIDELSRIFIGMRNKILANGKFPKELMEAQAELMEEYFQSINEILKPCKLEDV